MEHAPVGYFFHSINGKGELEWSVSLAIPEWPAFLEFKDKIVLIFEDSKKNLKANWTPVDGISPGDSTFAAATIKLDNPVIRIKRELTKTEMGVGGIPISFVEISDGLYYGLNSRQEEINGYYRYFHKVGFFKFKK